MPGTIQSYFRQYRGTKEGFVAFHNEVINMPRPDFQNMGLKILQTLASYLLLIEHRADDVCDTVCPSRAAEFLHRSRKGCGSS